MNIYEPKPNKEKLFRIKEKDMLSRGDEEMRRYVYRMGFFDINFFANYHLGHFRVDEDTGEKCPSPPFHTDMLETFKKKGSFLVLVPRSHAKTTNIVISTIHDICYQLESGILFVMQKGLGEKTVGKIRMEFESNITITDIFGRLVPNRTRYEQSKGWRTDYLVFTNGMDLQTITKKQAIRGARKTKIHIDDPEEDHEVTNGLITQQFRSWVAGTIIPIAKNGKLIVTGTVIGADCFVLSLYEHARSYKKMRYEACTDPVFNIIDGRKHLVGGDPIRPERRPIETLNKQLQDMQDNDPAFGEKVFMREFFNKSFIKNGRPVFPLEKVDQLITPQYTIDEKYPGLRIYNNTPGEYARGGDTADGGVGGDYSTITIRDKDLGLVACYRGHIISKDYVELLEYILTTYKFEGLIGIEKNRPQVIELAKDKYRAMLLYKTKTIDKITNRVSQKYGFTTTSQSKPLIIDNMVNNMFSGLVEIDERTKVEIENYYYDEQGRANGIAPHHDDLVMSDMICQQMIKEM